MLLPNAGDGLSEALFHLSCPAGRQVSQRLADEAKKRERFIELKQHLEQEQEVTNKSVCLCKGEGVGKKAGASKLVYRPDRPVCQSVNSFVCAYKKLQYTQC